MNEPKKILIVRTDRLGDVILSTPVIENLRKAYPKARIAFMCRPYTARALEGNPYLDEVIIYDKYGRHKSLPSSVKFAFRLRKENFDWALVLHPTNRAHLVVFLAGIPFRVGWDRKNSFLLNRKIFHAKQEGKKHELEYTLDILRELNIPVIKKDTYFPVSRKSEAGIDEILNGAGLKADKKLIVVHPCASCPSKRWPRAFFCELIEMLKKELDCEIAVISSEEEKNTAKEPAKLADIDLRGKLDISEVGALLKRADLFISNDSGPVHIAAALNVPVISIFGRKDAGLSPTRWKPLGEKSFYAHKDSGCEKCLAHNCEKNFLCLKTITPKEIFSLAKKIT